jgi:hypothetical protein
MSLEIIGSLARLLGHRLCALPFYIYCNIEMNTENPLSESGVAAVLYALLCPLHKHQVLLNPKATSVI